MHDDDHFNFTCAPFSFSTHSVHHISDATKAHSSIIKTTTWNKKGKLYYYMAVCVFYYLFFSLLVKKVFSYMFNAKMQRFLYKVCSLLRFLSVFMCPIFNLRAEVTCQVCCRGSSRGGRGSPDLSPQHTASSAPRRFGASDTCGPSSARTLGGHTTAGSPAG